MDNDKFQIVRTLLRFNRSCRRYDASRPIPLATLENLVELTRYCASSQNIQPLRYHLVVEEKEKERLFPALKWARHLKDWEGPTLAERPVAYIVQLLDTRLYNTPFCDCGLELEAITLGAAAVGINSCIIRNFNPGQVHELLQLKQHYKVEYVVALGYAAEHIVIDDMQLGNNDYNYYRDTDDTHHVPKRLLQDRLV